MAVDGWPCLLSQAAFANPVRLPRCTTGTLGPVNGTNKDVSGIRLLPMTVATYDILWIESTSITY